MSPTLYHLRESGMSFIKKHHWQERRVNFSERSISPWNTEEVYRQPLDSKRTVQVIQSKVVASRTFPLHQFWERQNYGGIQGSAEETLQKPSRWSLLDGQARRIRELARSTIVKGSFGLNISL